MSSARDLYVVVGVTGGIGRAVSDHLLSCGVSVLGVSRKADGVNQNIVGSGSYASVAADLTDEGSVANLFGWIRSNNYYPIGLLNAAGVGHFSKIADMSLANWKSTLDTNLTGSFLLVREFLRFPNKGIVRRIAHVGSTADHHPFETCAAYGASKYGLRGFVEVCNVELCPDLIFSTLVSLGAVDTPIWDKRDGFDRSEMLNCASVAKAFAELLMNRDRVRVDSMTMLPPKGIL
jgi:NAD(P)-dependent dehydrogenase (short-subunit alcohol dehydrogenase family)